MSKPHISIIGGGNLGAAIAEGLLNSSYIKPEEITVTRRQVNQLKALQDIGVNTTSDNHAAIKGGDIIIIALKPFNVMRVLEELKTSFDPNKHIVISVVTGVPLADFTAMLPDGTPIFRAMPNTAIAIQESVTCICHAGANEQQSKQEMDIFNQLGITVPIDEQLMNAATVLGACGVAYALRFIRAASQGGIEIGFAAKTANLIAAQTVKGSAKLMLELDRHPEEEIDKVTTPKGCTITGLNEMEHQGFSSSLIKGIVASFNKISE